MYEQNHAQLEQILNLLNLPNKIISFNKRHLQETQYTQSKLNLTVSQINQISKRNLKSNRLVFQNKTFF